MNEISLQRCVPKVFTATNVNSGVWNEVLTFEKGKSYLVKALSGRGKSSLCSYLMGYRDDYTGTILYDNTNINSFDAEQWAVLRQMSLSYVPQGLMLFEELSAYENIALKNKLTGFKSAKWIKSSLLRLGLSDRADFPVSKLSYGQRQRVALLRALCQPFDFIILDEPVSHLDDTTASALAHLLSEELKEQGAGLIATSIGKELIVDYNEVISL